MEHTDLKLLGKSGLRIPSIGMGTWGIGGYDSKDTSKDREAIEALQRGIELGMWLTDTAEMYGAGHAEELVGQAIQAFPREKVFIVSKVLNNHLEYEEVIKACHRSLERLQTDFIDLYLVHFPNYEVPLQETMEAMEKLVEQRAGKIYRGKQFPSQFDEAGSELPWNYRDSGKRGKI